MAQQINIKGLPQVANKKAQLVEIIANNLDVEALEILAEKSKKPNISAKLKKFKNMI
jgi:hypothetical protein